MKKDKTTAHKVKPGDILTLQEMIDVMGKAGTTVRVKGRVIFLSAGDYECAQKGQQVTGYAAVNSETVRVVNFSIGSNTLSRIVRGSRVQSNYTT